MSDLLTYRIAFSSLRSLTPALAGPILERVGSEQQFFALPETQLSAMMGFNNKLFSRATRDAAIAEARREAEFIESASITPLYFPDRDYPARLLQCDDAPLMLYALGNSRLDYRHVISIVGTRHATAYGNDFVERLISDLAALLPEKPLIVSGLAYGIDIAAHRAALRAGLPTAAVLAHGLNTIYPAQHRQTAIEMLHNGGTLLTDYRSGTAIHKGNFLARNRIVAGLADTLIVVESASKGGALVTARLAAGYNRDVFALPGRITDKYSSGCNALIASHIAGVITSASDLCRQMGWQTATDTATTTPSLFDTLTGEEQTIVDIMTERGEVTLQELGARIDIPTPRLMAMLIDMEFRSLILAIPGGRYRPK
ncbi:MAG: DNA-processing protein DprA [Staphylococcus sp.]|nr:DNA-processing protein DprA [Staphylococcus sp.]